MGHMYCQCGCGQKTSLYPYNDKNRGMVKGQPRPWLKGHFTKGKKLPPERCAALDRGRAKSVAKTKGKPLPEAHREAIRRGKLGVPGTESQKAAKRGPNNPIWAGGYAIDLINWATAVKERDNYTCQTCGTTANARHMHAHHIKTFRDYPDLRFDVSNGKTLCARCHMRHHAAIKRSGVPTPLLLDEAI